MKNLSKLLSVLILTFMLGITAFAAIQNNQVNLQEASKEQAEQSDSVLF